MILGPFDNTVFCLATWGAWLAAASTSLWASEAENVGHLLQYPEWWGLTLGPPPYGVQYGPPGEVQTPIRWHRVHICFAKQQEVVEVMQMKAGSFVMQCPGKGICTCWEQLWGWWQPKGKCLTFSSCATASKWQSYGWMGTRQYAFLLSSFDSMSQLDNEAHCFINRSVNNVHSMEALTLWPLGADSWWPVTICLLCEV